MSSSVLIVYYFKRNQYSRYSCVVLLKIVTVIKRWRERTFIRLLYLKKMQLSTSAAQYFNITEKFLQKELFS